MPAAIVGRFDGIEQDVAVGWARALKTLDSSSLSNPSRVMPWWRRALQGLEQPALAVRHFDEGLRVRFARHRPEPRAGAAGQDDGDEHEMFPSEYF